MHPFKLQSAALKEFDFLLEVSRPGPLVIPSMPAEIPPEQLVPPSPQPVVEFPEEEVEVLYKLAIDREEITLISELIVSPLLLCWITMF